MTPSTATATPAHPSYLALDRAVLGQPSPELAAHLAGCAECRAHVDSLASPALVLDFQSVRGRLDQRRRAARRARWTSLGLAVAAASALFIGAGRRAHQTPLHEGYVASKGFASVWIYVKRGAVSELWDGKKPVLAGDRLRIKVDPGSYRHVQVYSQSHAGDPTLLYAGDVSPGQSSTLPNAWELDDEPEAERLFVVFSLRAVEPTWQAWRSGNATPGVAVLPFVLPKSSGNASDAGAFSP